MEFSSEAVSGAVARYSRAVRRIVEQIEQEQILEAARIVADCLAASGIVHVFGTGHSSLLAQEAFYRAGGLVAVNAILDPRLGFERGVVESSEFERSTEAAGELAAAAGFSARDAGIVISNSGRNGLPVEIASRMKSAGMRVMALTNLAQSKNSISLHPSGKRLFEVADLILDNHCPPGDAAVTIEGLPTRLGPLSTIAGAAILHSVFVGAAAALAAEGKAPAAFPSANLMNGTLEDLRKVISPYQDRIRRFRPDGR